MFSVSQTMPLASVSAAFLFGHAGLEVSRWSWAAAVAAVYGLTFALGLLLGGWVAGAAAAALMLPFAHEFLRYPINLIYALSVQLVAGLLVRRARAPSPANGALLGLAIGVSLLHRSPLVFFPLLLAAFDALPAGGPRPGIKGVLPLVALPFLLLTPWIAMNWSLHGEFIPLERNRIEGLLLNSLNFVEKVSFGTPGEPSLGGTLVTLGRMIFRDPGSYLWSSLGRLRFIVTPHYMLFLAAAAGLLLGRRRPEFRALALLAAYFTLIHCGLSISEAYLVPLWPLLAALAAAALPAALEPESTAESSAQTSASRAFVVCLLPAVLASLFALASAFSYPRRVAAPEAPEAPGGTRDEAWPLLDYGRRHLALGELARAREAFSRALTLRPEEDRVKFYLAWTQALEGHPDVLLKLDPATLRHATMHPVGLPFLKAVEHLRMGRNEAARVEILSGLAIWSPPSAPPPAPLLDTLDEFLRPMPAPDRERLMRAIAAVAAPERVVDVRLSLAYLALDRGDRRAVLEILTEVRKLNPEPFARRPASVSELRAAAVRDPRARAPWLALAGIYASRKEFDKELAAYEWAPNLTGDPAVRHVLMKRRQQFKALARRSYVP